MPGTDIGIDLGTASILIYIKGKGIVLKEPSVVAVDKVKNKIVAYGTAAQRMLGRTPDNIQAIRPLRDGVISDYDLTQQMLRHFIKSVCEHRFFKPRIMICVPSRVTEVEERAVLDAAIDAGARKVYLIEEPIAAAIGAGIDITKPMGNMVVDIGGGTTDIAVLSIKEIAVSDSVRVAGDKFDEAIIKYIRRKYSIQIGERTAEEAKFRIGCVVPKETKETMQIKGRSLITGMPNTLEISSEDMMEALHEPSSIIYEAIHSVLERTPPELVGDIITNGIVMTGGGSLIYGLDKLISKRTGIGVCIAEDPISCVAKGTGRALENLDILHDGLIYVSSNLRRQQGRS